MLAAGRPSFGAMSATIVVAAIAGFPQRLGGRLPMAGRRALRTVAPASATTLRGASDMAAHPAPAPEFPLLAIFAGLIVVAMVPICLVLVAPSMLTLIVAVATVAGFAIAVTALLARMIGSED